MILSHYIIVQSNQYHGDIMPVKQTDKTFTLRIDVALYEQLASLAKLNRRSVNKEIVLAVEERLAKAEQTSHATKP